MIAKELAKQLQDAGFPLARSGKGGKRADPTLSALIEACEPNHFTLEQEDEQKWMPGSVVEAPVDQAPKKP